MATMNEKGDRGCRPPLASSQLSKRPPTNCQQWLPLPGVTVMGETPLPNSQQNFPQPGQPTQLHHDPVERPLPHQPSLALPCPSEFSRCTAAQQKVPATVGNPNSDMRKQTCSYRPPLCPWCLPSLTAGDSALTVGLGNSRHAMTESKVQHCTQAGVVHIPLLTPIL